MGYKWLDQLRKIYITVVQLVKKWLLEVGISYDINIIHTMKNCVGKKSIVGELKASVVVTDVCADFLKLLDAWITAVADILQKEDNLKLSRRSFFKWTKSPQEIMKP